jgi:hypothetical protein
MQVKVGDVVKFKTGEILKFEEIDPEGTFSARVKSVKDGQWTDYRLQGESIKLPLFLRQQGAIQLDPKDHPEPEETQMKGTV